MCKNVFEEVFKTYGNIYKNILSNIYPALKSTGFPERNLSVNFSKAYEKVALQKREEEKREDVYSWFEFQFSIDNKQNNRHIDAVIVNNTSQELLIIEAKRYSHPYKKLSEIGKDIDRICEFKDKLETETETEKDKENDKDKDKRIELRKINKIYGVILADVWANDSEVKKEILQAYVDKNLLTDSKFSQYIDQNIKDKIKNVIYDVQEIDVTSINSDDLSGNYHLVSLYWEIKLS